MTKKPLNLATSQLHISKDVSENGREIRRQMRLASEQSADLIHFPEGAMSGYVKNQIWDWQEVDWQTLKDELEQTKTLAGELGIWAVIGSSHPLSNPNRPHNSLYVFSSEGRLHTRYDKQWCSNTEVNDWYTPGQSLCVFEVKGWRFGCAICIEVQFPELFLSYANEHIDCLLYSTYADKPMFSVQAQGYAASHNYWISFSNVATHSDVLTSRLIAPNGELQTLSQTEGSSFVLSTLDGNDSRWHEALNLAKPWRKKARQGDIYQSRFVSDPRSTDKTSF